MLRRAAVAALLLFGLVPFFTEPEIRNCSKPTNHLEACDIFLAECLVANCAPKIGFTLGLGFQIPSGTPTRHVREMYPRDDNFFRTERCFGMSLSLGCERQQDIFGFWSTQIKFSHYDPVIRWRLPKILCLKMNKPRPIIRVGHELRVIDKNACPQLFLGSFIHRFDGVFGGLRGPSGGVGSFSGGYVSANYKPNLNKSGNGQYRAKQGKAECEYRDGIARCPLPEGFAGAWVGLYALCAAGTFVVLWLLWGIGDPAHDAKEPEKRNEDRHDPRSR